MTMLPVAIPRSAMTLDDLARRVNLHPELLRRFIALGLLDPLTDGAAGAAGADGPTFGPNTPAAVAQICRLHVGLGLNYAAIGVVIDLLARIDRLEATLRARPQPRSGRTEGWISTR
jgi:chaperone modulatory protein CbpM